MSSQSVCCKSQTAKGTKCRRNISTGEIYCFQHRSIHTEQSNIIHTVPAYEFSPISFLNDNPYNCCNFKNEYGEFICKEEKINKNFCTEHEKLSKKLKSDIIKIIHKCYEKLQSNSPRNTFDSTMKLFYGIINYVIFHKKTFVSLSHDKKMTEYINMLIDKISYFITVSQRVCLPSNMHVFKKSLSRKYHVNKLIEYKSKMNDIFPTIQIEKARKLLVSNSIKVHKLSEIYIKNTPNDIQPCPVFCKGIDKKILSFIV